MPSLKDPKLSDEDPKKLRPKISKINGRHYLSQDAETQTYQIVYPRTSLLWPRICRPPSRPRPRPEVSTEYEDSSERSTRTDNTSRRSQLREETSRMSQRLEDQRENNHTPEEPSEEDPMQSNTPEESEDESYSWLEGMMLIFVVWLAIWLVFYSDLFFTLNI